jgi:hypothetical protein
LMAIGFPIAPRPIKPTDFGRASSWMGEDMASYRQWAIFQYRGLLLVRLSCVWFTN